METKGQKGQKRHKKYFTLFPNKIYKTNYVPFVPSVLLFLFPANKQNLNYVPFVSSYQLSTLLPGQGLVAGGDEVGEGVENVGDRYDRILDLILVVLGSYVT